MNNIFKFFLIVTFIVITMITYHMFFNKKEKIGFVDLPKLMNEFKMKKELENDLTKIKEARQGVIDSLELELKILARQLEDSRKGNKMEMNAFQVKRENYFNKKKSFEEDIEKIASQFNTQIANQINQYVKDFGLKNHYTMILGAEGSGVLMYAVEDKNITGEAIKFINESYSGVIK
jgi:outer membrane protein